MAPFCSRSRSPSARNRKSNLPRSAAWANWTKESNSMWLPAAGALQTVGLLTPGKCAARWICLGIGRSSDGGGSGGGRSARCIAVGGARQPEQAAQGARLVGGAEQPAPLQLGDQRAGDPAQVVRQRRRPQPEPGEAGSGPLAAQVGRLRRGAGEDPGVAAVLLAGGLVQPLPAGGGGARLLVEEHPPVPE